MAEAQTIKLRALNRVKVTEDVISERFAREASSLRAERLAKVTKSKVFHAADRLRTTDGIGTRGSADRLGARRTLNRAEPSHRIILRGSHRLSRRRSHEVGRLSLASHQLSTVLLVELITILSTVLLVELVSILFIVNLFD